MAEYNSRDLPPRVDAAEESRFAVPNLCSVPALMLVVLFSELLVLVMMFGGGELGWMRFALTSLGVQWVALVSAGLLCGLRSRLERLSVLNGAMLAFALVMFVTVLVSVAADRLLAASLDLGGVDWRAIGGHLVIAGIISALALRYFQVQQQLRAREQAELKSRIQALQSRIRPHFLFNSMNIIASLIATDPETAESVVEDLSELFRASLNDAGNQVALQDELALCERYMRIEALRLGSRLQLDWTVPPLGSGLGDGVRIPLLTLQPLLENAIYHGIQPLPEGGVVSLRVTVTDDEVSVDISNPLPPREDAARSQGNRMAISNIRSRLAALYGSEAELTTHSGDGRFVTRLRYPRRGAARHHGSGGFAEPRGDHS
jgi:two-component system sensor histidine kinase AlgZ